MTADRGAAWREVRDLFDEVVDLDPVRRSERLAVAGTAAPALRSAVELLLAADADVHARLARLDVALGPDTTPAPCTANASSATARAMNAADPLGLTGRTVAHFRVLEILGAGGMGVIYRAEDTRLGRTIALKFPLPERCLDSGARERFLREGRAAGALDHPNLCSIHEVGETDEGYLFMAMTLYSGETLATRLGRDGALPVPVALEVARAIARGLGAVHAADIVHRDVKPANVMLLPDGGVKVLDFGLAKVRDLSFTAPSGMMGTVSYMAPEQIRGTPADARADVWALGVVLYEMLTGRRPFTGEHEISIAHAIVHEDAPLPSDSRPDVPRAVDEVVSSLLQKDPERRPSTAREAEASLVAAALGQAPRSASGRVRLGQVWGRYTKRTTARVAVGLVGLTALAATAYAIARPGTRAPAVERSVAGTSTSNTEAQGYYVSGREYERRALSEENLRSAQAQYRRALALDSTFALARARLAITHATMFAATYDASPPRLALAWAEAEAALRSQPDLGEGHLARGNVWTLRGDFGRALAEYQLALVSLPNSTELHTAIGFALRGQGRWEEAVTRFEHAATLDSRDVEVRRQLALSQSRLRRYDAAIRTWDRVIELRPDDYHAKVIRGSQYIRLHGNADSLAAVLQQLPPEWDPVGLATWLRFSVARIQRRPGDALAALDASRQDVSGDDMFYRPRALLRAQVYDDLGDARRARAYYDTARVELADSLTRNSRSARLRIALGLAYVGLGHRERAVREARAAMAIVPVTSNAVAGTAIMADAAEIYARAGDHDTAIALLGQLLEMPAGREVSVQLLGVDPRWDPLRADARFVRMLAATPP